MEEITTIKISKYTKSKLDEVGKKGESYEDIILRVLIELNERRLKVNGYRNSV
jgi:hypothetical protein